ncbi:sigma-70 region 2 domain-containing protein [Streptomyces sp. AA4]|nr:sigma-70 region 2 domain-containing protein [Streptomyces sp. AA4]
MTGQHDAAETALAQAFRDEWGSVVATLIRVTGDWDLAEECAQDAFALAVRAWPRDGVPDRPGAWLTTAARNRAVDRLRRASAGAGKLREVALLAVPDEPDAVHSGPSGVEDDRLRLIFTCCHPALAFEAQVALALRTLVGLSTAEIARAFLVSESTMSQRLVRVKRKIRAAGIPYRVPPSHLLPERTAAVLGVLYLLFNEGYSASEGDDLQRPDLAVEAIRLARLLRSLLPDEPEATGLLALLLLQHARRRTRNGPGGELVPLEEQDRTQWDAAAITEGTALLEEALRRRSPGPYQVQAAIAACHATAARAEDTDWAQIAGLYLQLRRFRPGPVVELNRAVAVGMADGPEAGLALADRLAEDLAGYHLLPATRADFLRRLGRTEEARVAYEEALALAPTGAERSYLRRRISEISSPEVSVSASSVRREGEPTSGRTAMITNILRAPGAEIHYDVAGSGPLLLLVPGGPADATGFAALRPCLADRYTVVTFDPRGISRSWTTDLDDDLVGQHAEDVQRLLAELDAGPVSVLASSGGAITMLEHTTRYPGAVRTLVAHEPPVSRYLGDLLADFPDIPAIYREQGVDAAVGAFMAASGFEIPPPPEHPSAEEIEQGKRMRGNFEVFFGKLMGAIGAWEPDLEALSAADTRIVVAVGDAVGTPAYEAGVGLARALGGEPVRFPGDHAGFAARPEAFAARLAETLNEEN